MFDYIYSFRPAKQLGISMKSGQYCLNIPRHISLKVHDFDIIIIIIFYLSWVTQLAQLVCLHHGPVHVLLYLASLFTSWPSTWSIISSQFVYIMAQYMFYYILINLFFWICETRIESPLQIKVWNPLNLRAKTHK